MTLPVIRYPLDLTGKSTENLVPWEEHALPARLVRMVVPHHGAFFTESMVVVDVATGRTLVRGVDYYCGEKDKLKSLECGQEICCVVIIINQQVSNSVKASYQCYGGIESISAKAIIEVIASSSVDGTAVDWKTNVIGKPDRYIPAAHKTEAYTLYGMEYIRDALRGLRSGIEVGDDAIHRIFYELIDMLEVDSKLDTDDIKRQLDIHVASFNNPHHVTAAQADTYLSTEIDALLNTVKSATDTHVARRNNPHGVTPDQVDTYTKVRVDTDLTTLSNTISGGITTHAALRNNPHEESASALGIYTVAELSAIIAPTQTATTGHINALEDPHDVTLLQLSMLDYDAVNDLIDPLSAGVTAHLNRRDNPHSESAASLGLQTKLAFDTLINQKASLVDPNVFGPAQVMQDSISFSIPGIPAATLKYKAYVDGTGRHLLDIMFNNKSTGQNFVVKRMNLKTGDVWLGGLKVTNGDIVGYDHASGEIVVPTS